MITAIVFSKNRALQLEALLRSLRENCDHFDTVHVQYHADQHHQSSYEVLATAYPGIQFTREDGFKATLLTLLPRAGRVAFFVDDDIVFRPVAAIPECPIFSLRLGDNVANKTHFQYTGSLDGNVFQAKALAGLRDANFTQPNALEIAVLKLTRQLPMRYDQQCVLGIPNNRVSEGSGCSHMDGDCDKLLSLFERGARIDYKSMDFRCRDVHKYIEYAYIFET